MYRLESSLLGHDQDVRAVSALSNDLVLSAARDKTVRSWKRTGPNSFELNHTFTFHDHFINALTTIPSSLEHPNGLFVSGGSDKLINICDPSQTASPLYTLVGHTENVCALDVSPGGDIVSGSWDKKAIVWKNYQKAYVLTGHEAAVWGVLALDDDVILTASADKTIRLWKHGKQVQIIRGHTDVVRSLAKVPGVGFVSSSNDGTLRVWSLEGECLQELHGHTSFVYSVDVLSTGEFVSSGEDRTVRIWKDGECVQTLQQPCISVWTVSVLPNDDIAVGGSDATVRLYTRSAERFALAEDQKALDEVLASQSIPSNQLGDVNKEKLPGPDALLTPGKKEGQVIMVNAGNGTVEAHQWNSSTHNWTKIGEVVGGVGSDKKQIYEGVEYDHVFDIDIGGGPNAMLKLPYNLNQNPYDAAQKFVTRHELSQGFLDQIADFITTNTKPAEIGPSTTQYQDPFTGGNRYTPGQQSSQYGAPSTYSDPFTGGSSYRSSGQPSPVVRTQSILPIKTYLALKQTNLSAVQAKLRSLNNEAAGSSKLSDEELGLVAKAVDFLSNPQGKSIDPKGLEILVRLCQTWPVGQRFPALDILRLYCLSAPAALAAATSSLSFASPATFFLQAGGLDKPVSEKVAETNAMLAYRGLANLLFPEGREALWPNRNVFLNAVQAAGVYKSKATQLAASTLAVNLAVLLTTHGDRDEDGELSLMSSLLNLIKNEGLDEETLYRLLVSLGTLLKESSSTREAANIMELKTELQRLRGRNALAERITRVLNEMVTLMKA
ncbi:WD40-repeat-containing domain protein [Phycomyces blakesleeanus]|uniref:WD40-repeat-containing domain protein n=1 Tax=Phycomyces blakesleeanus TaxID=4837 RepID=A0ABR3APR3_PHYBL